MCRQFVSFAGAQPPYSVCGLYYGGTGSVQDGRQESHY